MDYAACQAAYLKALQEGDERLARAVIGQARMAGAELSRIYFDVFAPSMVMIGNLWEQNQLTVAEEHLATAITERLIGELSPLFGRPGTTKVTQEGRGTVVLGCVAGERHTLGLRMLADLFRREHWHVLDLGADVPLDDWVRLAIRYNADAIAISASATRYIPEVEALIASVKRLLPNTIILVGGAVFNRTPDLWSTVGADLYQSDPHVAVEMVSTEYDRRLSRAARLRSPEAP